MDPNHEQKEWRDPRDGQRWVVSREQHASGATILFRIPGEPDASYSIGVSTKLSLMRTSDGRLTELLDQARATPEIDDRR